MDENGFGFGRDTSNNRIENSVSEGIVYKPYLGKLVRIDVAGGIGGTGVLDAVDRYGREGHALYLSPFIFYDPNHTPRKINDTMMVLSVHSNASVLPIPDSIEDYLSKISEENVLRRKKLAKQEEKEE